MKYISGLISKAHPVLTGCLALSFFLFSNCGSDPEPETTRVRNLLTSGVWSVQTVTANGTDLTTVYKDLKLTFTEGGFTASGGLPLWPATGTWTFPDDSATKIKRGDNVVVTITAVEDKELTYTLPWTQATLGPGRVSSINGDHVFVMVRP
jgi:hypothetical protein